MSSSDRYSRSNRTRREPAPSDSNPDDDLVLDDQWDIDPGVGARVDNNAANRTRRPAGSNDGGGLAYPTDGTAAQLDRLRRNLRQSSPPAAAQPSVVRRPSASSSRASRQSEPAPPTTPFFDDDEESLAPARPTSTRPRQQAVAAEPRRRDGRQPRYDDDTFSDDPFADCDEFDDGFSAYDAPRPPERRPRPPPQLPIPAIPRPPLPTAIAKADLVNDAPALGIIVVGLASLAAMAIVVANQAESLAPAFATHVSASGILENVRDDSALWNVPLMAGVFTLMNIAMAWFISPLDRFASRFVLVGALVAQVLAWVAIIRIL